jgi:DNA-directed RNA polymerase subunit RPC12/RpoP
LIILISLSSTVVNAWSAGVDYGPTNAYQSKPFKFHVTITNAGSDTLHVNEITLTIYWPDWPFDEPEPTERHYIFSGDQSIAPGDSRQFEKQITTSFFGSFSSDIKIVARSLNESASSVQVIPTYMSFQGASEAPTNPLLMILLFSILIGTVASIWIFLRGPWGYDDVGMRLNQVDAEKLLAFVPNEAKLYPDETIGRYWATRFKEWPTPKENENEKISGLLVATNQRLFFVKVSADTLIVGVPTKKKEENVIHRSLWAEIHLEDIQQMHLVEDKKKAADLTIDLMIKGVHAGYRFSKMHDLNPHTLELIGPTDAKSLETELNQMIQERVRFVEAGRKSENAHLMDFSTLRERMMRIGIVLKTIRCPSCGGDVEAPPSGTGAICKYCGSEILAQQFLQ